MVLQTHFSLFLCSPIWKDRVLEEGEKKNPSLKADGCFLPISEEEMAIHAVGPFALTKDLECFTKHNVGCKEGKDKIGTHIDMCVCVSFDILK